jgi:hypothetical protein
MKTRMMALSALAMIVAGGAMAGEPLGMQRFSFEETWLPEYVPCLGELVTTKVFVEVTLHEFVSPSGVYHFAGHTDEHYLATDPSGREWVGRGGLSVEMNLKKGESYQFGRRSVLKPTTDNTPMYMFKFQSKLTLNANGKLVVERLPAPPEEAFKCLPNRK